MISFSRYYLFLLVFTLHSTFFNSVALAGPLVDINSASAAVLSGILPGIGPAKAKAIVDYRELRGRFQTIDELINVKGIGEVTLGNIKPYLFVGGAGQEQSRMHPSVSSRVANIVGPSSQNMTTEAQSARRAIQAALNIARRFSDQYADQYAN